MIRDKYEEIYPFLKTVQFTKFNQLAKKPFGKIAETYEDEIAKIAEILGKDQYSIIKYLENFEESEHYYVIQILLHVKYFSRPQLTKACQDLFATLCVCQNQNLDGNFGFYIPISEMGMKGSHTILNEFRVANNLPSNRCLNSPLHLQNITLKPKEPIFLLDDFIGSGESILTWWETNSPNLPMKNPIYIAALVGLKEGVDHLTQALPTVKLVDPLEIIPQNERVLTPDYIFKTEDIPKVRKILYKYGVKNYELGRNESQAMVTFDYRTPNNTISLLWNSNLKYPLFRR